MAVERQNLTILERTVITLATLFFAGVASLTFSEIQKMNSSISELNENYAVIATELEQFRRDLARIEERRENDRDRIYRLEQWRYDMPPQSGPEER